VSIKTKFLILFLILCNLPYSNSAKAGENELKDFRIGEKSILADVDENPDVMANWTVARIKYYKYSPENYHLQIHVRGTHVNGQLSCC